MTLQVLLLNNPLAGTAHPEKLREVVDYLEAAGATVELYDLTRIRSVKRFIAKRFQKLPLIDRVLVAGGDGSVRAVMEAVYFANPDIPVGILPWGTGNLLAKSLNVHRIDEPLLNAILGEDTHPLSVTRVNNRIAALVAGAGLDADIMQTTDSRLKRAFGPLAYVLNGALSFFRVKTFLFEITVDGNTWRQRAESILLIQRNHFIKAFLPTLDTLVPCDEDTLDVCLVHTHNTLEKLDILRRVFTGELENLEGLTYFQTREVKIRTRPPKLFQIDGDITPYHRIHARIVPNAVKLCLPSNPKTTVENLQN